VVTQPPGQGGCFTGNGHANRTLVTALVKIRKLHAGDACKMRQRAVLLPAMIYRTKPKLQMVAPE